MPRVDIDNVGILVLPSAGLSGRGGDRAQQLAPYGRGSETVLDTSVRKVWQLAPSKLKIGANPGRKNSGTDLAEVATARLAPTPTVSPISTSCSCTTEAPSSRRHRDTEKVDGMFGTLLIVLAVRARGRRSRRRAPFRPRDDHRSQRR